VLLVGGRLRIAGGVAWTGVIAAIGQGTIAYDADALVHVTADFHCSYRDVFGQRLTLPNP
jgi:hypothetical protein